MDHPEGCCAPSQGTCGGEIQLPMFDNEARHGMQMISSRI
jgi:hypothetical protein